MHVYAPGRNERRLSVPEALRVLGLFAVAHVREVAYFNHQRFRSLRTPYSEQRYEQIVEASAEEIQAGCRTSLSAYLAG